MSPRSAITFAKSPTGAFLTFCFLLVCGYFVFQRIHPPKAQKKSSLVPEAVGAPANAQIIQSYQNRGFSPLNPPPVVEPKKEEPSEPQPSKKEEKQEILPISLYAETPEREPKQLSKNYAPFGRLIPCELIITVDSSSIRTPIVGLITEDIYHAGRRIIPAGTEVHGTAQTDRMRERIASGNRWTLVWQTGEELPLSGIALDREKNADGEGWGITDGSAGLRGRMIKSDDIAEIKLFAASFLSGAAGALTDREYTIFGSQSAPTLHNAPFKGAQDVLAVYAKQIYESIQRNGFYVRVPAGKQFYLYVTETIDGAEATLGGTRAMEPESKNTNQTVSASIPSPNIIQIRE